MGGGAKGEGQGFKRCASPTRRGTGESARAPHRLQTPMDLVDPQNDVWPRGQMLSVRNLVRNPMRNVSEQQQASGLQNEFCSR